MGFQFGLYAHFSHKSLIAGVEVFVFHWGCTRLGALGDDQGGGGSHLRARRGRTCPPSPGYVLRQLPEHTVPCHDAFCTANNEKTVCW